MTPPIGRDKASWSESSVAQPTRRRKQVNRHSSGICRWVTVHNLLPGSAASNWSDVFPPKTAVTPSLSPSPSLVLPTALLSKHSYTVQRLGKRTHTCTDFQLLYLHSYLPPIILLWWQQTFSIWRATSDWVLWQIWKPSGGSVWLCDEKSAVIQEPSVILPSKEQGLHRSGFKPRPAHTAMRNDNF